MLGGMVPSVSRAATTLAAAVALTCLAAAPAEAENLSLPGEVWTAVGWKSTEGTYLPGVVHSESGWVPVSWFSGGTNARRQQALQAQAVAARTYLLRYLNANGMSAKIPIGPQFQAWTSQYAAFDVAAVSDSAGVVMTWNDWVITANYASGAWPVDGQGWPLAPKTYGIDQGGSAPGLSWADVKSLYVAKQLSDKGDGYSWTWVLVTVNEGKSGGSVLETPQSSPGNRNRGSLAQYRTLWLAHTQAKQAPDLLRYWYGADVTIEGWGGGAPPPGDPDPPPAQPDPPGAPTGLTPTGGADLSSASVTLDWSSVGGASSYELEIQYQQGASWTWYWTYTPTASAKTFWPQVDPATYRWRVRAKSGGGTGPWSGWATFDLSTAAPPPPPPPPPAAPDPPSGLSPSGAATLSTPSVTLAWQGVSGVSGYQVGIDYLQGATTWGWYYTYSVGAGSTALTFWPQVDPTAYRWRVRAQGAGGWGAWSGWATFDYATHPAAGGSPPPAPGGLSPSGGTVASKSVALSWDAVATATGGYEVEVDRWTGSAWAAEGSWWPAGTALTFWADVDPATYRWRVRAKGAAGWGPWALWVSFDLATAQPPAAPVGLTPSGGTVTTSPVTLTWSAVSGATGYQVEIDRWAGSSWADYYTYAPSGATATFWPQVDPATYRWRVRAHHSGGWTGWSWWVAFDYDGSASGGGGGGGATPSGLWPSGGVTITTSSVTLSWGAVPGAASYQAGIQWLKSGVWTDYYTYEPSAAATTFWPQVDPASYRWRVRAWTSSGWGPWSGWAEFWFDD